MTIIRRALDALYSVSAGLAALSLLAIFLVMMAQVVGSVSLLPRGMRFSPLAPGAI